LFILAPAGKISLKMIKLISQICVYFTSSTGDGSPVDKAPRGRGVLWDYIVLYLGWPFHRRAAELWNVAKMPAG